MGKATLEERVMKSANLILLEQKHVSVPDILVAIGWLDPSHIRNWRKGKIPNIEREILTNLEKITNAIKTIKKVVPNKELW